MTLSPAVDRYLAAEAAGDFAALAAAFLPHGVVLDERRTHVGRAAIAAWRTATAKAYTFTTTITAEQRLGPEAHRVTERLEGDFPGGVADVTLTFALKDDNIAALTIL